MCASATGVGFLLVLILVVAFTLLALCSSEKSSTRFLLPTSLETILSKTFVLSFDCVLIIVFVLLLSVN